MTFKTERIERLGRLSFMAATFLLPIYLHAANNQNQSDDPTSLNYYPHARQLEMNPHITMSLSDLTKASNGTDARDGYTQVYFSAIYGLIPRLRIGLFDTLLWDEVTDSVSAANVESINLQVGPSNPTGTASWRFIEDPVNQISSDLYFAISPSLGKKINPDGTNGKVGNNLSGGWSEILNNNWYWVGKRNQLELAVGLTCNSPAVIRTASGGDSTEGVYLTSSFTLTHRYHFNDRHFIQESAEFAPGSRHHTTTANNVITQTDSLSSMTYNLEYGFLPDPGIILEFVVSQHTFTTESIAKASSSSTQAKTLSGTLALIHTFD